MTVYYVTIIFVGILSVLSQKSDYKVRRICQDRVIHTVSSKFFFFLCISVLIFVAGFRYRVGTDFNAYFMSYERYAEEFIEHLKTFDEPGLRFIAWCIVKLGGDGTAFIFATSFITIMLSMRTIYNNTSCIFMAAMLYIFCECWHGGFNGVRQYLASAIVFCGIKYIRERRFWHYLLVIWIAFLFHSSALVMLPLYFVAYNKVDFKNICLMIAGSIAVLLSFDKVLGLAGFILKEVYLGSNTYVISSVNIFRVVASVAPAAFYILMFSRKKLENDERMWLNLLIVNATIMVATSNSAYLARTGIYPNAFVVLAIPELSNKLPCNTRKIVNALALMCFFVFWWYDVSHSYSLNSFRFIWQQRW